MWQTRCSDVLLIYLLLHVLTTTGQVKLYSCVYTISVYRPLQKYRIANNTLTKNIIEIKSVVLHILLIQKFCFVLSNPCTPPFQPGCG